MKTAAIVLAAGAGTRMKSDKPKVAHEVLGKPLVNWVLDAAEEAGIERLVTVVGHKREQVIPLVEDRAEIVVQEEQRGTAHAVLSCSDALADFGARLQACGVDKPSARLCAWVGLGVGLGLGEAEGAMLGVYLLLGVDHWSLLFLIAVEM